MIERLSGDMDKWGDGMSMVVLKYRSMGNDYLVYDAERNHRMLDAKIARTICSRNFGLSAKGILTSAATDGRKTSLQMFCPDGREARTGNDEARIYSRYLRDAGYLNQEELVLDTAQGAVICRTGEISSDKAVDEIGKLFLSEEFVSGHCARINS